MVRGKHCDASTIEGSDANGGLKAGGGAKTNKRKRRDTLMKES